MLCSQAGRCGCSSAVVRPLATACAGFASGGCMSPSAPLALESMRDEWTPPRYEARDSLFTAAPAASSYGIGTSLLIAAAPACLRATPWEVNGARRFGGTSV